MMSKRWLAGGALGKIQMFQKVGNKSFGDSELVLQYSFQESSGQGHARTSPAK